MPAKRATSPCRWSRTDAIVSASVISSDPEFLSSRHLTRIARWDEGDIYRRSDEMDLRRAMLATGLLGSVELTPVVVQEPSDGEPGIVDIEAELTKPRCARLREASASAPRKASGWREAGSIAISSRPKACCGFAVLPARRNSWRASPSARTISRARDRILTVDAFASTIDYDAYDARSAALIAHL